MLTDFQKNEIVLKHSDGMSNKEISENMNLHRNVISFWINRFYKTGTIINIKQTGRKRKTTKEQDNKIVDEIKNNEKLKSNDLLEIIENYNISKRTICRRLSENGFVYGNYSKKSFLTEKHKLIRLNWAKEHIDFDWTKVIFSDEMSIWKDRCTDKCWYIKGNQKIKETLKHPIKVHIWGCITLGGFESYYLFKDNLNSDKYMEILFEHLVPIYVNNFIFQQDNSPIHTSKKIKDFLDKSKIKTLKFPPNSPDLNPIENVWHLIKHYMSKITNLTNENFEEKINECCKKIDYSNIHNIVSSMHIRIQKIIRSNGNHIDY
jgi:transposase